MATLKPAARLSAPGEPYRPSTADPAQIFVDLARDMQKTAEEMKATVARFETLQTEARAIGARDAAAAIVAEVPRAMRIAAARSNRRLIWFVAGGSLAATLFLSVALSLWLVYWFMPQCVSHNGGTYCYAWFVQPGGR